MRGNWSHRRINESASQARRAKAMGATDNETRLNRLPGVVLIGDGLRYLAVVPSSLFILETVLAWFLFIRLGPPPSMAVVFSSCTVKSTFITLFEITQSLSNLLE